MEHVEFFAELPPLRNPALVAAFAGWNDAAEAATTAARFLVGQWSARRFAAISPEEFYDFTQARPYIRWRNGLEREIRWPANEFFHAQAGGPRDIIILIGVEPHLKWRTYVETVLSVVRRCGANFVVALGALLADVAHSRPVRVTGSASDEELARLLQLTPSRYEGPTGIVGVLLEACRGQGLSTATLWASVPHYIAAVPNPKATLALLQRLGILLGLDLTPASLEREVARFEAQVAEAVAANPEIQDYVRQLEAREDEEGAREATPPPERPDLPSGEAMVRELEEFLKQLREQNDT